MSSAPADLVQPRARNAFREYCVAFAVVRQIERCFEDEGLEPGDSDGDWWGDGQRRGVFDRWTANVDWANPSDVRKVLNAFEEMMQWGDDDNDYAIKSRTQLVRHLRRDGYVVDDAGRIRSSSVGSLSEIPLEHLKDASAILEHIDRITTAADTDPGATISAAKAVIEATTKLVLKELGATYNEKADVPELVKAAQKVLKLHPEMLAPTAPGVETSKRILSNLSQVAFGVAELRNQYGADHGRSEGTVGLGPRHAHLAVGCAATYCRMLLETLAARRESDGG